MNVFFQQLKDRKSVRAFTDKPITEYQISEILKTAIQAPTAGNQQLYTIIHVTDPKLKEQLAVSCDNQPFIAEAPLVLVFCADCRKWYRTFQEYGCEPRKPGVGDLMLAVCDAVIAAQNTVVAAHSAGIGSCYIGDIMENAEQQRKILSLPAYVFPVTMVVYGYPTQQQIVRPKPRRSKIDYVVQENGYRDLSAEELKEMHAIKAGDNDFEAWIKAFCDRKYNSDFSREMTRSVKVFLEDFQD